MNPSNLEELKNWLSSHGYEVYEESSKSTKIYSSGWRAFGKAQTARNCEENDCAPVIDILAYSNSTDGSKWFFCEFSLAGKLGADWVGFKIWSVPLEEFVKNHDRIVSRLVNMWESA